MATDDLYKRTHALLEASLDHMDRVLAGGGPVQRQQALELKAQLRQTLDKLEQRQKQGKKFDAREAHILEHIIPVFSEKLPPVR